MREYVVDALTPRQITALTTITDAILDRLDPDHAVLPQYRD